MESRIADLGEAPGRGERAGEAETFRECILADGGQSLRQGHRGKPPAAGKGIFPDGGQAAAQGEGAVKAGAVGKGPGAQGGDGIGDGQVSGEAVAAGKGVVPDLRETRGQGQGGKAGAVLKDFIAQGREALSQGEGPVKAGAFKERSPAQGGDAVGNGQISGQACTVVKGGIADLRKSLGQGKGTGEPGAVVKGMRPDGGEVLGQGQGAGKAGEALERLLTDGRDGLAVDGIRQHQLPLGRESRGGGAGNGQGAVGILPVVELIRGSLIGEIGAVRRPGLYSQAHQQAQGQSKTRHPLFHETRPFSICEFGKFFKSD